MPQKKPLLVIYFKYSSEYMPTLTSQFISLHLLSPLDICPGVGLLYHRPRCRGFSCCKAPVLVCLCFQSTWFSHPGAHGIFPDQGQTCVPCTGRRTPITGPPESPHHIFFTHSFVDCHLSCFYGISIAQTVQNLPAMRETWVQSLCWEAPLEQGMATHSRIPAWRIPWTEEPGGPQSMGSQSWTRLSP